MPNPVYLEDDIAALLRSIVLSHSNALAVAKQDGIAPYHMGFISAIVAVATAFGLPYEKVAYVVRNSKWELTWKDYA